ncbi:MAG TPA: PAS domain S-box protein [Caldilineaceae bacterium]|nr:PAS domain S-box protein [Caldilineaceae bacterium]
MTIDPAIERRQALLATGLLDSPPEAEFDRLTRLACRLLHVPVSLISLVDDQRQFFKSAQGLAEPWASRRETPLSHSFCKHVVFTDEPLVVSDARIDIRLCENLAINDLQVVAYLGIPLRTPEHIVIGSLCAIDSQPRNWSEKDVQTLSDLAAMVMTEIAARHYRGRGKSSLQRIKLQTELLNAVEQAVIATDLTGTVTYWNRFAEKLYGWTSNEALGRNVLALTQVPALVDQAQTIMANLQEGKSWRGELLVQRRDGTSFPAYVMDSPVQNEQGELIGIVGISFDISERKAKEMELDENLHRLRLALNAGNMGIWDWDLESDMVHMSDKALTMWGISLRQEPHHAANIFSLVHPEDLPALNAVVQQALAQRTDFSFEFRVVLPSQNIRWLAGKGLGIYDETGKASRMIGINYDITTRKVNEQLLQEVNETLEQRVADRTADLERSNRELQEFAYVASHDLQEPLRKITAFADRLRSRFSDDLDDVALDYMARMQNSAERMKLLINDLLTLSRVTTQAQPFAATDLNTIATNVLRDLETTIEAADAKVTVSSLPTIEADQSQIGRVFQNLISNAIKFQRPGERPEIEISSELIYDEDNEPYVCLRMKDNGIGFDEKYLDRIFLPFQRLHGRNDYEGSGMGLAICRRIVERHGGTIRAQSAPNQGATFLIMLPLEHTDVQPQEQAS